MLSTATSSGKAPTDELSKEGSATHSLLTHSVSHSPRAFRQMSGVRVCDGCVGSLQTSPQMVLDSATLDSATDPAFLDMLGAGFNELIAFKGKVGNMEAPTGFSDIGTLWPPLVK